MTDSDWSTELAKIGYEAQHKFDFYAVALAYTVLGLAVQTAHFGSNPLADFFELAGWLSLLISGIAGLHRLEWQPQVFQLLGLKSSQEERLTGLRKAQAQGTTVVRALDTGTDLSISNLIVRDERDLNKVENRLKEISGKANIGYRVRSIALLVGLLALILSRGIGPAIGLVKLVFP